MTGGLSDKTNDQRLYDFICFSHVVISRLYSLNHPTMQIADSNFIICHFPKYILHNRDKTGSAGAREPESEPGPETRPVSIVILMV